jgi:hypothetical protein
MSRPDNDYIRAKALKFVSTERGACDAVSDELCTSALFWKPAPRRAYQIHALVKGDYAQNHIAMAAHWDGDAEGDRLIVDPSIGQFGGDARVFIGNETEWLAELSRLHNGAPAELDPGGSKFNEALFREMEALASSKTAAIHQEQSRSAHVSKDSHMADTLKKTKPCCGCVIS